jgi:hypothetical protein
MLWSSPQLRGERLGIPGATEQIWESSVPLLPECHFAQVETREGLLPVRPLCQVPCLRPDLRRQHRPRPTRVAGI